MYFIRCLALFFLALNGTTFAAPVPSGFSNMPTMEDAPGYHGQSSPPQIVRKPLVYDRLQSAKGKITAAGNRYQQHRASRPPPPPSKADKKALEAQDRRQQRQSHSNGWRGLDSSQYGYDLETEKMYRDPRVQRTTPGGVRSSSEEAARQKQWHTEMMKKYPAVHHEKDAELELKGSHTSPTFSSV